MNASFLCLFVDGLGEGCSSHPSSTVDKAEQAKQSRAAVLEDMNSWTLDPETSPPLGGRPRGGECPWNGFGTLAAQYDVYTLNISFPITLYLSISPLLSVSNSPSVSFCPSFSPSSSHSLCLLVTIHQITPLTDLYKPLTNQCTESCAAVDVCLWRDWSSSEEKSFDTQKHSQA